jgi:VWFA-related protein
MRSAYVALAVSFALSALGNDGAPKLPPLVERIDVTVTNVDVVVTDRAGHAVSGLTRDDFEILEDGKPQFLTNFYAIEDATVREATTQDSSEGSVDPDQFRRKIVLLIDNNFIPKPSRDAALTRLAEFIDTHIAANCEWTLIAIGHSVTTVQPFTSSKSQIHAAIDRVRHMPTNDEQQNLDREILSDPVRRTSLIDAIGNNEFGTTVRFKAREQTMRNLSATQNTARAVIQTCRAFSAAEGKKVVILVTGGMEMNTTFKAYQSEDDPILNQMKRQTDETLDLIVREANAANVNLYVIGARNRGMQAPQHDVVNQSAGTNPGTVGSMQDVLGGGPIDTTDIDTSSRMLAMGTGGLYLPANNVSRGLERIDEETSTYYSLGYSPQHGEDGVYHHISVRVKRPGLDARHRAGYENVSLDARLEQSLLAPISLPKEQGSLPVRLNLGIPDGNNGGLAVPVVAELPLRLFAIVPREEGYAGRVHIYLSIYDGEGNNVGYHHFIKNLTVARDEYACISTAVFHYRTTLRLKPGRFTILVTLRDDVTNELGTATQFVHL